MRPANKYLLAALAITAGTFLMYQDIVLPRDASLAYPWSSDAWGHLIKAVYLREEIGQGNWYPDLFPSWYSGQQMLRYFPPLPYYMLVGLYEVTGSIWTAGNIYLFLGALGGGLSLLLFGSRIGIGWATAAGLLYVAFPDNIRVAFAEGNLPRVMATALLPVALYFLLNMLQRDGRTRDFIGLVVIISLIVLSHAMMAAIFLLGLGMFAVSYWLVAHTPFRVAGVSVLALGAGLAVSGWWMLPSLTGGITELDQQAASEAIAQFPVTIALNPGLRSGNLEIFYAGLSVLLVTLAGAFFWRRMDPWMRALLPVAVFMALVGSTLIVDVWRALPAHHLFWPLRFMSFSGLVMIIVSVGLARIMFRLGKSPDRRWMRFAALAIPLLIAVDFLPSQALVHGRELPQDIEQVAVDLRDMDGWRVGTADLSRLGSVPAMLFTTVGNREQVFGWAFQGSITAPLLARVNQSMTDGHLEYAVNRFERLGADDIVLLSDSEIDPEFGPALADAGYELVSASSRLKLYHRDGAPRAVRVPLRVLGIGSGANNLALLFPEISVGSSANINDYDPTFLDEFDTLVLSRFVFDHRGRAEEVIRDFAASGKTVLVDLTSAPPDPLAREPKFLGVYGEPVLQMTQARTIVDGEMTPLLPFSDEFGPWRSVTPQGADEVLVPFEYMVATGAAVARNTYGEGQVIFLGLNLMFHAAITADPTAIRLLEDALGIPAGLMPQDEQIELSDYSAHEDGWRFSISMPNEGWVLLPMAHHGGTSVEVNGRSVETVGVETLTLARMPGGTSSVHIKSEETAVYPIGRAITLLGLIITVGYSARNLRRLMPPLPWRGRARQTADPRSIGWRPPAPGGSDL
ncbi:MAG: 6-pyruvoyl-tetrahydropterin synthase-related protein [Dehalococcoidia bacterium]